MKKMFLAVVFLLACATAWAQVKVIKFPELEQMLKKDNDTIYVFNFWATWCKPCVEEMPYFEKLNTEYGSRKVQVVFISLDYKRDAHTRVDAFLKKNNIKAPVYLLDDTNYNSWIDRVDESWSGAIPATLISEGNVKRFYEQEFPSYLALERIVKSFLIK